MIVTLIWWLGCPSFKVKKLGGWFALTCGNQSFWQIQLRFNQDLIIAVYSDVQQMHDESSSSPEMSKHLAIQLKIILLITQKETRKVI